MRIVGITAEYNPFHQGHAFHLDSARRITGADYVIVAMSGNYVQRGVPAMFDKYTRSKAALLNGADLILELPPCIATGSAEHFASGAVNLFTKTRIVTDLCFGSECGDLAPLIQVADILAEEPDAWRHALQESLRLGNPWPKACRQALSSYGEEIPFGLLDTPNNLLGVEYLKALSRQNSPVRPHTVLRKGSSYHETVLEDDSPASAGAIRQALLKSRGHFTSDTRMQIPSLEVYKDYDGKPPITENAFSLLLLERLQRDPEESFGLYFNVGTDLANRIRNCLDQFTSFSQFTDLIKTRNLTRTAVSRALLHILLNIRKYEAADCFRVLGFRRRAVPLLKELANRGTLPLVTSPGDRILSKDWLYADRLYESVRSLLHEQPFQNERLRKMLVL